MRQKTLFQEFLKYIVSNICGMIGLSCYILADTYFISKGIGADGLTALNLALPIYSLVHGSGLMLGMGGAVRYSILRGQNDKAADKIFSNTISLAIILGIIFIFAGIFFSKPIAAALGASGNVFYAANIYLKVILLFAPAFLINNILLCFARNNGNPKLSMTAMLAGSFSNIIMDYLFIFPLHMGILGAVLATGFAPLIGIGILCGCKTAQKNKFSWRDFHISAGLTIKIVSVGIPSFVTEIASGIVMIVFNFIFLRFRGNIGVAAYSVVANLWIVVISIYTGLAQGMQPMVSRAFGCKDQKSMIKILNYATISILLLSACIYLVFFLAAEPIVSAFNSEGDLVLQKIAVSGLKLYFTAILFAGWNIMLSVYLASMEKVLPAHIISLARGFFLIIPLEFFLSFLWGIKGVWLSCLVTEGIVCAAGVIIIFKFKKMLWKNNIIS